MKVRLLGAERKGCVRETDARSIGEAEGRLLVFSSVVRRSTENTTPLGFFFREKNEDGARGVPEKTALSWVRCGVVWCSHGTCRAAPFRRNTC